MFNENVPFLFVFCDLDRAQVSHKCPLLHYAREELFFRFTQRSLLVHSSHLCYLFSCSTAAINKLISLRRVETDAVCREKCLTGGGLGKIPFIILNIHDMRGLLSGLKIKAIILTIKFLLLWVFSICCETKIFDQADNRMNVEILHNNTQCVGFVAMNSTSRLSITLI